MTHKKLTDNRIAIILLLLWLPITLCAAETLTVNNIKYTLGGDTAVVSGYENNPTGYITIPPTVEQGETSYRVTSIGERAFYLCEYLKGITLSEGLTTIQSSAFQYCFRLTQLNLPESLTTIGECAFSRCTNLKHISLPKGVTTLNSELFSGCIRLTTVALPEGLTTINKRSFYHCRALENVHLPKTLTYIGTEAFSECYTLANINLPEGLTTLGESAFDQCESLISINLPNSLATIGKKAFSHCQTLTSISLPRGATLYDSCFEWCTGLEEIHLSLATPPTIPTNTFDNVPKTCTLYVPKGSLEAYQTANVWQHFNIVEVESSGIHNTPQSGVIVIASTGRIFVQGAPQSTPIQIYTLSGQLITTTTQSEIELSQGIYLVRVAGESFKIINGN